MLDNNKPLTIEFENGSVIESIPNTGEVIRGKIRTYRGDENMGELIQQLLEKSKVVIDGQIMYRGEVLQEINDLDLGVKLVFTKEGVRWSF